jgi:hypothetical protein
MSLVLAYGLCAWAADTDSGTHDVTVTINEVAWLSIDDSVPVSFSVDLTDPVDGSLAVTDTGKTVGITYSSILPSSGGTRRITVQSGAAIWAGLKLEATASAPGQADGTPGSSAGQVELGETAVDIITGIGSVEKGTATITYDVTITDVGALKATTPLETDTMTITYTLTAASTGGV